MLTRQRLCASLLCIAASALVPVRAQVPVGSLNGNAHDQSGGVMQNVAITVTNKDTGSERQVVSGNDGTFGVSSLPAGTYVVRAAASGFRTLIEQATVQVGL